jgi:hypothetical protein
MDEEYVRADKIDSALEADPLWVGKCAGCGLIGKAFWTEGQLAYIDSKERSDGMLYPPPLEGKGQPPTLDCRLGHAIDAEFNGLWMVNLKEPSKPPPLKYHEAVANVLQYDRQCKDWEEWQPGLDPLWHLEHKRMRDVEELRLKSQEALRHVAEANAEHTAELKDIQRIQAGIQERTDKQTTWFNWLFAGLASVALVLSVGSFFYPDGIDGVSAPFARDGVSSPVPAATPRTP